MALIDINALDEELASEDDWSMDADEIQPINKQTVNSLLRDFRATEQEIDDELGRRSRPRWPFPGAVELWLPDERMGDEHVITSCQDLNEGGVGVRCHRRLKPGTIVSVAIHQPAMSLHGRATVRHCTKMGRGYFIGLEFCLDK